MNGTNEPPGRWRFWIDRGRTFTDVIAQRPDGTLVTHKLLSDNPEHYQDTAFMSSGSTATAYDFNDTGFGNNIREPRRGSRQ